MTKITKINNILINNLINNNDITQSRKELFSNIIYTLNPINKLYTSSTVAHKIHNKSHKVFINITYKFNNKFSANLFQLIFQQIILQDKLSFNVELNGNFVNIYLKTGFIIRHSEKFAVKEDIINKMEKSFAYKEDSQFISEVFLNTIKTIYFSDLYQAHYLALKPIEQNLLKNIVSATNDRVDINNGRILFNNINAYINMKNKNNENKKQGFFKEAISSIIKLINQSNKNLYDNEIVNKYL